MDVTTTDDGRALYASGAQRSSDGEEYRYDLISPIGMRRLAATYAEGARKYGPGNWLNGFPMSSLMNRVLKHLFAWISGNRSEDHLAHACWGLMALLHFDETRPDLQDCRVDCDPATGEPEQSDDPAQSPFDHEVARMVDEGGPVYEGDEGAGACEREV